jgi:hypothetical protein
LGEFVYFTILIISFRTGEKYVGPDRVIPERFYLYTSNTP